MTKDRALKLALEALDNDSDSDDAWHQRLDAKTAIKQALEHPVQEPVKVGRITDNIKGMVLRQEVMLYTDDYLPIGTALYTTPPAAQPAVPLTEIALLGAYEAEQQGRWGDHVRGLRAVEEKVLEQNK